MQGIMHARIPSVSLSSLCGAHVVVLSLGKILCCAPHSVQSFFWQLSKRHAATARGILMMYYVNPLYDQEFISTIYNKQHLQKCQVLFKQH
jgi:hypothetical protein